MWIDLRQVALVATDLDRVLDDLHAVFGLEVAFNDPSVKAFGLRNAVLPIGSQFLEVVSPVQEGTAAGRQLSRRGGDGGYMVITHTDDHPPVRARALELGIRIAFEFEEHGYVGMQLHPADTGGSFLEIDLQPGGEDPDGPWMPAGPDWQRARRTDVVDGVVAAVVQAEDPAAVAATWSDICAIPLTVGREGPVLGFRRGEVRFVPPTDGRGEGLSGVVLSAVDPDAARTAADGRGLLGPDGDITIAGTRFTLA